MKTPTVARSIWTAVYMAEFRTQLPNLLGLIGFLHIALIARIASAAMGARTAAGSEQILGLYWRDWLSPYGTSLMLVGLFAMWIGLDLIAKDWRERTAVFFRTFPVGDSVWVTAKLAAGFSVVALAVSMAIPLHVLGARVLSGEVSILEPLAVLPLALVLILPWFLAGAVLSCHMQRSWLLILSGIAIWYGINWALLDGFLKAGGFYLTGTGAVRLVLIHLFVALAFGAWVLRASRRRQFL